MIILTCSMVWRKLNQAWLSSSSISKLRFSSIIMLPSYSSIKSPFWLDYSADSSVAGFFLNPKSVSLQLQEIFFAFGVFFSRLKIQSERTIWWALQSIINANIFIFFSFATRLGSNTYFPRETKSLGTATKEVKIQRMRTTLFLSIRRNECHRICPW